MWIMVSGPYASGARAAAEQADNLAPLNRAALALFRTGHVPVIGVNLALPIIEAAGAHALDEIMVPLSLALIERCDACLRTGGASPGADQEADRFRMAGKPVYLRIEDVPPA